MIKGKGKNMLRKTILASLAALFVTTASAQQMEKPLVTVEKPTITENEIPRKYAGFVEAVESTDIIPRVTGVLLKTYFKEGDFVRKGQLLYELEDTTYVAKVESLRAQKESLEAALIYADKEFTRSQKLQKDNATSVASFDRASFEIKAARAKLKEINATLKDAENTLSYTKIYAPISGYIGKSIYSNGNLITPQTGKLTNITGIAPIYVRFSISEVIFRRDFGGLNGIKKNTIVKVQLADKSIYGERVSVDWVDNKIHATTNTISLWAKFNNNPRELLPGGFVTVFLYNKNAQKKPAISPSALIVKKGGYSVYIIGKDGVVIERNVKIGRTTPDGLQIVTEGLSGDELVITEGTHKVKPGMVPTLNRK